MAGKCAHETVEIDFDLRTVWSVSIEAGVSVGGNSETYASAGRVRAYCLECGGRFYYASRSRWPGWLVRHYEAAHKLDGRSGV